MRGMVDATSPAVRAEHQGAAALLARPVILRLASSCVAALITGLVVGGLGGRLAMRLSAMAADDPRIGLITDNGNVVGRITGEGTLALLVFVGLAAGLSTGVLLFVLRTVLPARMLPLSVSVVLLALGSSVVIDPSNPDFTILGNPALNVAMFAALFPAFGSMSVWLGERFDRWLVQPPLLRLAPLTLGGTVLGLAIGVLGIGVLASATEPLLAAIVVIAAVSGGVVALTRERVALVARMAALAALLVGTIAGLVGFVDDVVTIVG
jgi:hypothetical protein